MYKLFTIVEECSDPHYGWSHIEFFVDGALRDKRLAELQRTNRGINFADSEIGVYEKESDISKD